MEFFKGNTAHIIHHLFQTLLVTYLLLLLIEQVSIGFVSTYLNLNYLLIIVIISGILSVFSEPDKIKHEKPKLKDYIYIAILSISGFIIIKFKTAELGWLSYAISTVAGILIALLSILILEDDEKEEKKEKNESKKKMSLFQIIRLSFLSLLGISVILSFFMPLIDSARIVFGSVYVLFLPGYIISFIFFKEIETLERIALSFALSIAVVPLIVFYLNLIGIRINAINVFLIVLGIILVSLAAVFIPKKYQKTD